ncbi:MAG: VCBS repeat-containing protein [Phycisphaerales bacterium]
MCRSITLCAAVFLIVSRASAGDQLPGSLNFANVTADRIVQTVQESVSNEKEVEFGDFDNDGDLDVVIANAHSDFGQRRNKLYRNDDGVFNEISGDPIIPEFASTDVSRNAFLRDYDGDGWLDIWIINDGNTGGLPGLDKVYFNVQSGGELDHFQLVTIGATGASCGGVSIDADLDGDFDVFIGNYTNSTQNRLFDNTAGIFTDVTAKMVPPATDYTIDISTADINGDGTMDILVSNWGNNKLYYNNRMDLGSQDGDYSYPGSVKILGNASTNENAMEPGDFDSDGVMDIYWTDLVGAGDRILNGTVNEDGTVDYVTIGNLPASVATRIARKPTVFDLNGDGRVDVFVGGHTTRPTILRNTTVNGNITFVDWTPGDEFPNGNVHRGWHAAAFDSNNDGDIDIFLGGWTNDHLFENVPANEVDENDLDGFLPPVYNTDPVAVLGHSEDGEIDIYVAAGIGDDSFISVVLNGPDDYLLEVLDVDDVLLGDSDRGGLGVEEVMQVTIPTAGTYKVRVTVNESAGSQFDLDGDGTVGASDLLLLLVQWGTDPGGPPDFDGDGTVGASDLLALLINWGPAPSSNDYILEVLSRTGP